MSDSNHQAAPRGFFTTIAVLGPGIVVAGNVIGAGELINVPVQAAKFGFVLLWAVLISCVIKYFLQVELGRYAILHNRGTLEAFNDTCPGPRFFNVSWLTWVYAVGYTINQVGRAGILLATAGLLDSIWPVASDQAISIAVWGIAIVTVTQLLIWKSLYSGLEIIVTSMVVAFSLAALGGLALVQSTKEHRISGEEIFSGLQFSFGDTPELATIAVISFIGALGTAANELVSYPYWLLEKGYAKRIGSPNSEGWKERAEGWLRILRIDVGLSTLLATCVTGSFFLLGATVFWRQGNKPEGLDVVNDISKIFTQSYGEGSKVFYLLGAVAALFSSFLVSSALSGRMGADFLVAAGRIPRGDGKALRRAQQLFQALFLGAVLVFFLVMGGKRPPAQLVIFAQFVSGAFNVPLVMFGICCVAFRNDSPLRMRWVGGTLLLISVAVVASCIFMFSWIQLGRLF